MGGDYLVAIWRNVLLFFGKMPITKTLPNTWYNTPNLHMCTIKDLFNFCDEKNIQINKSLYLDTVNNKEIIKDPNLNADSAIFLIS